MTGDSFADFLPPINDVSEFGQLIEMTCAAWRRSALADSDTPLRRALDLAERSIGPNDLLVAVVLSHLG